MREVPRVHRLRERCPRRATGGLVSAFWAVLPPGGDGLFGALLPHGIRATASTILNELGYRPDVIERQLAHMERNKARASYNRAEYIPERKDMMQVWADYLDGLQRSADVIPLHAKS